MRVGVTYPQTELGGDPGAIRAYGQRVEELGYRHILAYDHVVGADPTVHTGWDRAYDVHTTFSEPLVMFGYLAAVTPTVELVTGVIILPQRQILLVAKQAAEVDLLSGGRLRLGVGMGWNAVEFEALGQDFANRGAHAVMAGAPRHGVVVHPVRLRDEPQPIGDWSRSMRVGERSSTPATSSPSTK